MLCFWAGQCVQMFSADLLTYWRILPVYFFVLALAARKARVKILFLDQFSELGGAQQALLDTVDAVQRRGWKRAVLLPGDGPLVEAASIARHVPVGRDSLWPVSLGNKSAADSIAFRAGFAPASACHQRSGRRARASI